MTGPPLSVAKQALLALEQMRERLAAAESAAREPIAIIGIGMRVPGAGDSDAFWTLLRDGVDATREVPPGRWDVAAFFDPDQDAAGKIYTKRGGFLDDVETFDAEFFGVSPREARSMDPQHRMLLEVAWEAIEHAGIAPTSLSGSRTGVFVGITVSDYLQLLIGSGEARLLDAYAHHGNVFNAAAGRLSYVLGLHGPSMAIDTACSSSLVAAHVACQSLRSRDCDLALAGGVNLVLSPLSSVRLARAHMLAPDGRCKTFDAAADGYARGEGCGVLVLKRLSAALADRDRILAVIRGSAVNQDGHTSALTVPNGLAQRAVIRAALGNAGIEPADVAYVEAHGTGTALGDPIEVDAIADVLGGARSRPLLIGSVKTNIGHLESASGVAGLIKVVLALQHEAIPPHVNFSTPSPHIPWGDLAVEVPRCITPWPVDQPRIAGVSSFGASGTNAHMLLERAPANQVTGTPAPRRHHVLVFSTESAAGLSELAARYLRHLDVHAGTDLAALCDTAAAGRVHFVHRAAVVGTDVAQLREGLAGVASGRLGPRVHHGTIPRGVQPKVAFMFTGQGSQYVGMGRELFDSEPVFRVALEECADALRPHLDVPLVALLHGDGGSESGGIDKTALTQPALFAIEYALARMLGAWGVEPAAVMGHSVGEYAAACMAGVLPLADAARLIARRGRLMQALPEGGAMVAITRTEASVREPLASYSDRVALAAVNAPDQLVLSGDRQALEALLRDLDVAADDRRWLTVSHAFHSPLMRPMLDPFEAEAATVRHAPARIPLVSNLSGEALRTAPDARHWRLHAEMPVRFADGVAAAAGLGCSVFVEIGPTPTLLPLAQRSPAVRDAVWIPTLRRGRSDTEQIARALAALYVAGVAIDWRAFAGVEARRPVTIPFYPFARERHWFEDASLRPRVPALSASRVAAAGSSRPDSYENVWQLKPRPASSRVSTPYVVVTTRRGIGAGLVDWLASAGRHYAEVTIGTAFEQTASRAFTVRPDSRADFERAARALAAEFGKPPVFVFACPAETSASAAPSLDAWQAYWRATCAGFISTVQALGQQTAATSRLVVVTAGALDPTRSDVACHQTALLGLARTVRREYPELHCTVVDVDPAMDAWRQAGALVDEADAAATDNEVALRQGQRYVARLSRCAGGSPIEPLALSGVATYLVSGGLGGAGFAVAEWLASRGARTLALVSRSQPSAAVAARVQDCQRRHGVRIELVRADISNPTQLRSALDAVARTLPPIRGVVHAAGVLDDAVLIDQNWSRFEAVFAGKVHGAWNLHELTQALPLDFFVMFSSLAGLAGSAGQANYASANTVLDGLALFRRARGLPAVSIAWGPWQVGMLGALGEAHRERWARQGLRAMAPERAISALDRLLADGPPNVVVADADWRQFLAAGGGVDSAWLEELVPSVPPAARSASNDGLLASIAASPATRRRTMLIDAIEEQARPVLGAAGTKRLDSRRPLQEIGLDSLMALELRNALGARLGHTLPATLLFDYPTIESVAEYVLCTYLPSPTAAPRRSGAAGSEDAGDGDLDRLSAAEAEALLLAELDATAESWTK